MYTVYTTFKNKAQAEKIARILISEKLIGCANIFPISSVYEWNKKIISEKEVGVFIKTTKYKNALLKKKLEDIHPYKIPVIETFKAENINNKYLRWITEEVK